MEVKRLAEKDITEQLGEETTLVVTNKMETENGEVQDALYRVKYKTLLNAVAVKHAYKPLSPNADFDNLKDGKYYISPDLQFTSVLDYTFDNPDTVDIEKNNIWADGEIVNDNNSNVLRIPANASTSQYIFGGKDWWNHGADIVQEFTDGILEFDVCISKFVSDAEQLIISPQHNGFRPGIAFIKNPNGEGILIYANNGSEARSGVSTGTVIDADTWHNYKVEYKPSAQKVNYYVDNVLVYSKTDYVGTVKSDTEIYPQMPKYFSIYVNTTGSAESEILIDSVKIYDTTGFDELNLDKQDILCQKSFDDYCVQFRIPNNEDAVGEKRVKKLYGEWGRWIKDVALDESDKIPIGNIPNIPLSLLAKPLIGFGKMNTEAATLTELPDNSIIILSAPSNITVTVTGVSTATIQSDTVILWSGGKGDDVSYPNFRRTFILYTSTLTVKSNNAVTKVYDNSATATISISCPANTYKGWIGNEE